MHNPFLELVRNRRSIRRFASEARTAEEIKLLRETALRSPSSRNSNPWEFIFVQDHAALERLSRCKPHGAAFLAGAALGIVICADERKSDVWVEDCSVAAVMLQFAAQSAGLGSCWLQVRKRKTATGRSSEAHVRDILNIPEHIRVLAIIGIGHPAETPDPKSPEELLSDRIHSAFWENAG
jgi:nitroreductase